ncbi:DUF6065 family protein [Actinopolymorpha singaporensis]|uniref:Uncharacterized protein n=1 Tax=Actinopolymorpha singaporensis TaxID=117157 RepID=A0A1H1UPG9_9ACTN|nr:DUF6065 family protein [Actinopolymorpha singaporensis]SDS74454.1 hypothetical protein SAMN04489717_3720 [Actinopolymorpha singaporensis]
MGNITLYITTLSDDLLPEPASPKRSWWGEDLATAGHAHHCLPLTMANSLGYVVRSPGAFRVTWDGDVDTHVTVDDVDDCVVDNHSAGGSFTIQPGFVPRTTDEGDFLMVRPVPNVRCPWFVAMEALIEAWWQPGEFGLVCLMTRAGSFAVRRGDPLAQMCVYRAEGGSARLDIRPGLPAETEAWRARRHRPDYRKDLDYLMGRHPDGTPEPTHRRNWKHVRAEPTP